MKSLPSVLETDHRFRWFMIFIIVLFLFSSCASLSRTSTVETAVQETPQGPDQAESRSSETTPEAAIADQPPPSVPDSEKNTEIEISTIDEPIEPIEPVEPVEPVEPNPVDESSAAIQSTDSEMPTVSPEPAASRPDSDVLPKQNGPAQTGAIDTPGPTFELPRREAESPSDLSAEKRSPSEGSRTPEPPAPNPLLSTDSPLTPESVPIPAPALPEPAAGARATAPTATPALSESELSSEIPTAAPTATPNNVQPTASPLNDPRLSAESPERVLSGPGEITITLEGRGWVFRSDLSTEGSWQFLSRERDGESTRFMFVFPENGDWNLVFDRQKLSDGGTERLSRTVRVGDEGSFVVDRSAPGNGGVSAPDGSMPASADERDQAARAAVAAGRYDEAIELWEQDAAADNAFGRRARGSIVKTAADTASVVPLTAWLGEYLKDEPDPETLASALSVFEEQAGYDEQTGALLESLVEYDFSDDRPEWLYKLARHLEKPGPNRNLDTARTLYEQVITGWPLSPWKNLSEERLIWLQRHYFRVR